MARPSQTPTAMTLLPIDEQGDLFEHVTDLTPLTELVLAPPIRKAIDRVLAQHYNAQKLKDHGLRPANRILFRGPPGTGKTVCAGAIALALGLPLMTVRQDGLVQGYMGKTSAALRKVFDFAHFFQTQRQGFGGIDAVVTWARTEHGGRQLPLFAPAPRGGCMRWGICDLPPEGEEEDGHG